MTKGAFHSTTTFENLETAANGTEISWKRFQKFPTLLNFRNANHSTENSRKSESKVEWKESFWEKVSENVSIPREVVLFLKILENVVPLATASCQKANRTFWLNGKRMRTNSNDFSSERKRETLRTRFTTEVKNMASLKQPRGRRQRQRQKNNCFYEQNNSSARASRF